MEKYSLGFLPTPVHELNNLRSDFPGYRIFIKRDDCTGLASGGNKTRKLEYLIMDAINKGCDSAITAGAQQSNHCRQTAAACAVAGLKCHLIVRGNKPDHFTGNLLLSHLLGAEIHFAGESTLDEQYPIVEKELVNKGMSPYVIPIGGSNFIGAQGYIAAVRELNEQLCQSALNIDYIFFASSSGGTQAGIALGKIIYHLGAELLPVCIDKYDEGDMTLEQAVLDIVNDSRNILGLHRDFTLEDFRLLKEYNEAGYGVITDHEREAISLLAKKEGIFLDPVYSGRAFYGMMDCMRRNKIKQGSNVLFWHTGGLPALFAYY